MCLNNSNTTTQKKDNMQVSQTPDPSTLGGGMAAKAAKDLRGRKNKLDMAIEAAGG